LLDCIDIHVEVPGVGKSHLIEIVLLLYNDGVSVRKVKFTRLGGGEVWRMRSTGEAVAEISGFFGDILLFQN
jgi:hypothetical protein